MKTPAFWYRSPGLWARLLSPFGALYGAVGSLRAVRAKPHKAAVPVICAGNIVAGGAGKTPTVLALARYLKEKGQRPVVLSRGYGGEEEGPLRVDPAYHTAAQVGDEPLLIANQCPCWVSLRRYEALPEVEKEATHILLDDGLQNPTLHKDISLLVIDGASGIGNGKLIPAGPLRERLGTALKRVQAVLMIGADETDLLPHLGSVPVLMGRIVPDLPADFPRSARFFAFAGIARPEKFFKSCEALGLDLVGRASFADHQPFTASMCEALCAQADAKGARLLTTEKDWIRLPDKMKQSVVRLPIKLQLTDEAGWDFLLGD